MEVWMLITVRAFDKEMVGIFSTEELAKAFAHAYTADVVWKQWSDNISLGELSEKYLGIERWMLTKEMVNGVSEGDIRRMELISTKQEIN